jgi:hypothetical protein
MQKFRDQLCNVRRNNVLTKNDVPSPGHILERLSGALRTQLSPQNNKF